MDNNNAGSLVEQIMGMGSLLAKATDIIKEATSDASMSGMQLWQSLVFSGIALGVEEVERHFSNNIASDIQVLRTVNVGLSEAIGKCSDMDAISAMSALQEQVTSLLQGRASAVKEMIAKQEEEIHGISRKHLLDNIILDDIPAPDLEYVGVYSFRRNPRYFYLWHSLDAAGKAGEMTCSCPACMERTTQGKTISETESLRLIVNETEGIGPTMQRHGLFLISHARDMLADAMEGTSPHNIDPDGAKASVDKVLAGLMRPKS